MKNKKMSQFFQELINIDFCDLTLGDNTKTDLGDALGLGPNFFPTRRKF